MYSLHLGERNFSKMLIMGKLKLDTLKALLTFQQLLAVRGQ
jgi:hypothetical protein